MLLGGSDDDNLFQWPGEKLTRQLDRIVSAGGNLVRNTMSDRRDGGWEVYPFARRNDGKYDLTQWNDEYWQRFDFFLEQTQARNIFVQIEVWDRFDFTDAGGSQHWQQHPYNPVNNINYSRQQTGLHESYPEHPGANKQPFFYSTPAQRSIQPLLAFQEAFVHRMLDSSLKFDHVLYCIDNETQAEPQWALHWARLIRQRADQAEKLVCITEMWDDWNLAAERHQQTFDHPEQYDFVDISQNNHQRGQQHWDGLAYVRQYLEKFPRPMNSIKVYGADGNKFNDSDQDAIERFWRNLLGGAAAIRFHRPDSGLGINDRAIACLRAAGRVQASVPMWNLRPATERLAQCDPNECYAAATENDSTVVLYFPISASPRSVSWPDPIDQPEPSQWQILWIDIESGQPVATKQQTGTDIQPPANLGNVVAVMTRISETMLDGSLFQIGQYRAFTYLPSPQRRSVPQPWVMYAPTIMPNYPDEHERWMHQQFLEAGIAVAGIDVGEAFGSPTCMAALDALYEHLVQHADFSHRPVLLGRSRGGLWVSRWAAEHPQRVSGVAGIYPVFDLRSYPGLHQAAAAYGLTPPELQDKLVEYNPISHVHKMAAAAVPVYLVHGAIDHVVPLEPNSLAVQELYQQAGQAQAIQLEVIQDQGHNYWPGFFRCQGLVDFVVERAGSQVPSPE
ncbi:MAG: prolyl oligopeptidase family serine peptidase [Pirellulaceae bacterium]|nr:prolyl oligopeptidase family serine peptidase [Pirellulaceae bacterium]